MALHSYFTVTLIICGLQVSALPAQSFQESDFFYEPSHEVRQLVRKCAHTVVPPLGVLQDRKGKPTPLPLQISDLESIMYVKTPKTGSSTVGGLLELLSLTNPGMEVFTPDHPEKLTSWTFDATRIRPWCRDLHQQRRRGRLPRDSGRGQRNVVLDALSKYLPRSLQREEPTSNMSKLPKFLFLPTCCAHSHCVSLYGHSSPPSSFSFFFSPPFPIMTTMDCCLMRYFTFYYYVESRPTFYRDSVLACVATDVLRCP